MQEVERYLVASTLIYLYITNMDSILLKVKGLNFKPRNKIFAYLYTHKPFNCGVCLSLWIGILLSLCTFNILFLTLPLTFKFLNKYL